MSNDSQAGKDRKTAIAPMLSVRNGKRAIEFVSHSSIDRLCQCGFIATWDRDTLAEELDIIEQATRKGRVKWMLTKPPNRLAHIDRVLSSPAFNQRHTSASEADALMRLADAICGFVRGAQSDKTTPLLDAGDQLGRRA